MSKRLVGFTDEEFKEKMSSINRELVSGFLEQSHLSDQTLKQYKSAIYIFCKWIHDELDNKDIVDLKPRHALQFQNFLINNGLSSSAIKMRRYAVSSLCGFIEVYYGDEYPNFRNIYTRAIPSVADTFVKEKKPLSTEEIEKLISVLTEEEEYQKVAYVLFTFSSGCRREESRQLLSEVINYSKHRGKDGSEKNFYVTHNIRAKGKGKEGKNRRFTFDERTMQAIKQWIEFRESEVDDDDCPYVFVSKYKGKYRQLSANTFNLWCEQFSKILGGRPVHPHLFRSSRATIAVRDEGKDIKSVQKLLGHESSQTTEIYVIRDDEDDLDDLY